MKSLIGNNLLFKIKSTTLAEVMVAMALLGLLITLTFSVLNPILSPDYSLEKLKSIQIIEELIYQNYFSNIAFEQQIVKDGIVIQVENIEYFTDNNYMKLDIKAQHQESQVVIDKWVRFLKIK